jgi:hypothetical protein
MKKSLAVVPVIILVVLTYVFLLPEEYQPLKLSSEETRVSLDCAENMTCFTTALMDSCHPASFTLPHPDGSSLSGAITGEDGCEVLISSESGASMECVIGTDDLSLINSFTELKKNCEGSLLSELEQEF